MSTTLDVGVLGPAPRAPRGRCPQRTPRRPWRAAAPTARRRCACRRRRAESAIVEADSATVGGGTKRGLRQARLHVADEDADLVEQALGRLSLLQHDRFGVVLEPARLVLGQRAPGVDDHRRHLDSPRARKRSRKPRPSMSGSPRSRTIQPNYRAPAPAAPRRRSARSEPGTPRFQTLDQGLAGECRPRPPGCGASARWSAAPASRPPTPAPCASPAS